MLGLRQQLVGRSAQLGDVCVALLVHFRYTARQGMDLRGYAGYALALGCERGIVLRQLARPLLYRLGVLQVGVGDGVSHLLADLVREIAIRWLRGGEGGIGRQEVVELTNERVCGLLRAHRRHQEQEDEQAIHLLCSSHMNSCPSPSNLQSLVLYRSDFDGLSF